MSQTESTSAPPTFLRWETGTYLGLLLLLLLLPILGLLAGFEGGGEELENRTLAPWPNLTSEAIAEATWTPALEKFLLDRAPLRPELLVLAHQLDLELFLDNPLPDKLVRGKDGFWFVLERVVGRRAGPYPNADKVWEAIVRLNTYASQNGIPLYFVVSPNKATMYPEMLPDSLSAPFASEVLAEMDRLRSHQDEPNSPLVDVWTPLVAERERLRSPDVLVADPRLRTLFRRTDRHWNVEAGRIEAKAIIDALPNVTWQEDVSAQLGDSYRDGPSEIEEVYVKLGWTEPYTSVKVGSAANLQWRLITASKGNSTKVFYSHPTARHTPVRQKLVVVRDSFLNDGFEAPANRQGGEMLSIAPYFSESVFVHRMSLRDHAPDAKRALLGGEVLVVQVVQGELGWFVKNIEYYEHVVDWMKGR